MDSTMEFFDGTIGLITLVIYFIPSIIAWVRRSRFRFRITLINLLLGWTLIGWFVALYQSVKSPTQQRRRGYGDADDDDDEWLDEDYEYQDGEEFEHREREYADSSHSDTSADSYGDTGGDSGSSSDD